MKNNNKLAVINMAFGAGSESKEDTPFDKYVGVAPFFVLGVNLSKDDMKALYPERKYDKDFKLSSRIFFVLTSMNSWLRRLHCLITEEKLCFTF